MARPDLTRGCYGTLDERIAHFEQRIVEAAISERKPSADAHALIRLRTLKEEGR